MMEPEEESLQTIIESSEKLLSLAKQDDWDVFQEQLVERETLVESTFKRFDLQQAHKSAHTQVQSIRRLNTEILDVVTKRQQDIQISLKKLQKGDKAKEAYRNIRQQVHLNQFRD